MRNYAELMAPGGNLYNAFQVHDSITEQFSSFLFPLSPMYFSFLYIQTLPYTWPHLIHYSGNHTYISWTKQTLSAHHKHYFALVLQYSLEAFLNMKREVRIVFMAGNFTEILQICEVSLMKTKLNCSEHTSLKNISTTSSWTISISDIVISDAHI